MPNSACPISPPRTQQVGLICRIPWSCLMNDDVDPFSPPNMQAAMAMIADYANINKLSPAELIDIFNTGIAVRQIALGANKEVTHA